MKKSLLLRFQRKKKKKKRNEKQVGPGAGGGVRQTPGVEVFVINNFHAVAIGFAKCCG